MFCPICKGEFREGFTYCKKCRVDLVEELPSTDDNSEKSYEIISKILALKIEDYLKLGGIIFILIAILKELSNNIFSVVQNVELKSFNGWPLFGAIMTIIYSVTKDILWGIFYVALGHIIGVLKRDINNEQNS